jgi:hypothetical protein
MRRRYRADFWESVWKTEGCWIWLAATNSDGYGVIWFNKKLRLAHHVACILLGIPLDEEHQHHTCERPNCVNPAHLAGVSNSFHQMLHRNPVVASVIEAL